jgi:integrase
MLRLLSSPAITSHTAYATGADVPYCLASIPRTFRAREHPAPLVLPLLDRAELPRIRFHDLRHTAATILLANGENLKAVQERLGHAAAAMTLDVYGHVLPDFQRAVADRLDRLFGT